MGRRGDKVTRYVSYSQRVASQSPLTPAHNLARTLTIIQAIAVLIANVIGTGVFVKARVMVCNVGTPQMVLAVWIVAGILSIGRQRTARRVRGRQAVKEVGVTVRQ